MRHWLLAILFSLPALAAVPSAATADESNFLVLPVTTDLQRSAWGGDANVCAYVLVNGQGLLQDNDTVRWKALDFDALRNALAPLRKGKDSAVIFHVFREGEQSDAGRLLLWALEGFGRRSARYRDARVLENIVTGFNWERLIATMNEKSGGQDGDEPLTGDGAVTVSPVRTVLSRYLYLGADCVVTLAAPFTDKSDGRLTSEVEKAIHRAVSDLKLPAKNQVLFRVRHTLADRNAANRFYATTARELAESLGFKDRAMQSSFAP
jgi:hypothetical protein